MKKILFLFVALIMSVTSAWATDITDLSQVEADAYYTIHCGRGHLTVTSDFSMLYGSKQGSAAASTTFDAEDANFQFQFVENGGSYYLFNVGAQKYSKNDGTLVDNIADAAAISLYAWGDGTAQPRWDDDHCLNLGGDNQVAINDWKTKDAGDQFEITKLEIANFTVSVVGDVEGGVIYKGNTYAAGKNFTAATANVATFQAISVDGYNAKISVEGNTVVVTYTVIRTIDTSKAYYIKNKDSQKYVVIPAPGAGNVTISDTDKSKVTFEQVSEGVFTIKGNNAYLGADGWNAVGTADAFNWTVAEYGDDAWTFNQQITAYKGYLGYGSKDDGSKLYCNKGTADHYAFVLEEVTDVTYNVVIEGNAAGKVSYNGTEYTHSASITANGIEVSELTAAEIENYVTTITIVGTTITVHYDYARKVTLDEIENGKAYMFVCERGQLIVEDVVKEEGAEAAPMFKKAANVSYDGADKARQFGLIKKGENYYLWSVGAEGFVFNDKSVAAQEDAWAINFNQQEDGTVQFTLGGKVLNMQKEITNSFGLIIDGWTEADGGNKFAIYEVGDFDASAALALLREPGDIDGDGGVDVDDVKTFVDELVAGEATEPKYDVNGDGRITVADITKLIDMLQK